MDASMHGLLTYIVYILLRRIEYRLWILARLEGGSGSRRRLCATATKTAGFLLAGGHTWHPCDEQASSESVIQVIAVLV